MKGSNGNEELPKVVVVMVPLPAQGHLNPLLHLSHLVAAHDIPVHFVGSSTQNQQAKVRLQGRDHDSKIHFHDFQLPPFDPTPPPSNVNLYIPPPTHLLPLMKATNLHLRQHVYHLLQQLSLQFSRVVVVHDLLTASVVQDLKLIPNVEAYTFTPISAFTMFLDNLTAYPEKFRPLQLDLKEVIIPEYRDNSTNLYKDCSSQAMRKFTNTELKSLGFESGCLWNTSRVIEGQYINLLEKLMPNVKHFAIGPLHPVVATVKSKHQCLQWLDKQEKDSVIYVSFGSAISLRGDQIRELAYGLDQSGQKFIWVLRKADTTNVFAEDTDQGNKIELQLPEGYEEKVRHKGIVLREWAPQLEILAHPSVGGFMSHCGWNSCMESLSMGVPMAVWPMYGDQPRNAYLVSHILRVGVVVRNWAHRSELLMSNTIENAVKELMVSEEGKEIKKRAENFGEAIRCTVTQGGVSCLESNAFIAHITRQKIQMHSRL